MSIFRFAIRFALLSCLSFGMTAPPSVDRYAASSNLEEDASYWNVYTEGAPTWEMGNGLTPALDGKSLRCAITGGQPYSNAHCYRNLPAAPNSNFFILNVSFYYKPVSTFNNVGGDSIVQALEFTVSKWDQGLRYEWALQWDNIDTGAPKWRYWDPAQSPKWVDIGLSGEVSGDAWHTLILEGEILDGKVHYRRFSLDDQEHSLEHLPLISPANTPGEVDRLAVAVQIDGNKIETPYEIFIDKVSLSILPSFADVSANYWAYNFIERLLNSGITGGCGNGNYCPTDPVTRAQMAVFLLKGIHGPGFIPPIVGTGTGFTDVDITHWAAAWIKQLAAEAITGGCGSGIYCPESTVTRAQMAVFLLKAIHGASYSPPPATGTFTDVAAGYWAAAWIEQLAAEGITGGCGTGVYCPENPVTRDQMAVFLVKAFNLP